MYFLFTSITFLLEHPALVKCIKSFSQIFLNIYYKTSFTLKFCSEKEQGEGGEWRNPRDYGAAI